MALGSSYCGRSDEIAQCSAVVVSVDAFAQEHGHRWRRMLGGRALAIYKPRIRRPQGGVAHGFADNYYGATVAYQRNFTPRAPPRTGRRKRMTLPFASTDVMGAVSSVNVSLPVMRVGISTVTMLFGAA